jgi:hypothetical protein
MSLYYAKINSATVNSVDTVHSEIFNYGLQAGVSSDSATQANTIEGLWWKQEPNVTGFVALANVSQQAVNARLSVSDSAASPMGSHTVTVPSHETKVIDLTELRTAISSSGGISITYQATSSALIVNGGLEDPATGYSSTVPFRSISQTAGASTSDTYAELGLMTGAADPTMHFPAGTIFTPYTIVRNPSSATISVTPTLHWMQGGGPHSAQLPLLSLQPYGSLSLSLSSYLAKAGLGTFSGDVNLTLHVQSPPQQVLIAGGSVDHANTYVFAASPSRVAESVGKSLCYWSTGNGDDTMVTLWNPADEAQDVVFRLGFSGGHYLFPVHLEPQNTRAFNISEVLNSGVPDSEGNLIPASVNAGSAELHGVLGENQHILAVMDAGTYNVRKATCTTGCTVCRGAVEAWVAADPFGVPMGSTTQLAFTSQYNTGSQYDRTSLSSWSSTDTTVATVAAGLVSGQNPGLVEVDASDDSEPLYSDTCQGPHLDCPINTGIAAPTQGGVGRLLCTPTSLMRGNTVTCTVTGDSVASWSFSGSPNFNVSGPAGVSTWSGVMAVSGTVTAVGARGETLTSSIAVTARGAQQGFGPISAPSPQLVANGSTVVQTALPTLTSPPDTSPGSMGQSAYGYCYHFQPSPAINDSGPNQGLAYLISVTDCSAFGWELNPGLTNPTDPFYQHQGNCFPTVQQIIDAVRAHEIGLPGPSHYSQLVAFLPSNNPATAAEAVVAAAGSLSQAADNAILPVYQAAQGAAAFPEPPTNLPANINYSPYRTCP